MSIATTNRRHNWILWLGFLLCLVGFVGYFPLVRFPITRDVPWLTYLFFACGFVFEVGVGADFPGAMRCGGVFTGAAGGAEPTPAMARVVRFDFHPTSEGWKISEANADVPGGYLKGDLIGIERDPTDGTILAAFKRATKVDLFTADHPDCRDATDASTGIYRVNPQTGAVSPFVTRGTGVSICFPDDIAIDPSGNVYVSDLELGVIWKFDRAGHGGIWSDDPLLGWTEQTGTWNANYGTVLGYIGINTVALSPDGRLLATVSGDPETRMSSGSEPYSGATASSCRSGTIRFWEQTTGKPLGPPRPEVGQVYGLRFSPTCDTFVTLGTDKIARLWQTDTGKPLGEPMVHPDSLAAVAFSRAASLTASAISG